MDQIDRGLQLLAVDIDTIRPHPRNVHHGDIPTIATSLTAYGQYKPVIVQTSTGLICAGNHTWKAAKSLNWHRIAALFVDLDDERALKILVMDNRAAAKGTDDDQALAHLLQEFGDLAGTGFTDEELTALLASLDDTGDEDDGEQTDPGADLGPGWGVAVPCRTEDEQEALLLRLTDEGFPARPLNP